jgi:tetratricopeptide (TPR) repeat protein
VTNDQVANNRLSPAEAHNIVRQRLKWLLVPRNLHPNDVHRLAQRLHLHIYRPGEIVVPRGVRADCLGLVVQGQVAVRTSTRRSTRAEVILLPGSTFGENMLAHGRPSSATLQAMTRCEIWLLRRTEVEALTKQRRAQQRAATVGKVWPWVAFLAVTCLLIVVALNLPPTRQAAAVAPLGLGQWCSQKNLDPCTELAWTGATILSPSDANAWLALGNLYVQRGEIERAERAFEQVLALAPDAAEGYNNMGVIYAQQGEHEQAITAFEKALELQPGTAIIEQNLALSLLFEGDLEGAVSHYQTAIALAQPLTNTLVNTAIAYYEAGETDRAVETAREALDLDEDLAPAYTVMGAAALESRQSEEALADLQQAVAADSSYCQAHYYLGLAYKSLGQTAEAIVAFEQALSTADDEATRVQIRRYLNELYGQESQHSSP